MLSYATLMAAQTIQLQPYSCYVLSGMQRLGRLKMMLQPPSLTSVAQRELLLTVTSAISPHTTGPLCSLAGSVQCRTTVRLTFDPRVSSCAENAVAEL